MRGMNALTHNPPHPFPLAQRHPRWNYLALLAREARPVVQIIFLLRFAVGVALSASHATEPWDVAIGGLSWWLAVVAVYAFNGVMDFDEDVANGSGRPIASGALPRRVALAMCLAAAVLAIALASAVPGLEIWVGIYLAFGWWYSAPYFPAKLRSSTAGGAVFALGISSYLAGAASGGGTFNISVAVFGLAGAGWMTLVGTLIKDLSDVEGDAEGGRRTLAVRYGVSLARHCATAGGLIVGCGSVLAAYLWAPRVIPGTLAFAAGALCLVIQDLRAGDPSQGDRKMRRSGYRVFMRTQYAANLLVLVAATL